MSRLEDLASAVGKYVPPEALVAYCRARSLQYTAQYGALNLLSRFAPGLDAIVAVRDREFRRRVHAEIGRTIQEDVADIRDGITPASVLLPEDPRRHLQRIPRILWDGVSAFRRRRLGRTTVFDAEARAYLPEVPRYYRRNFHFQTNGYLSERSAELYEHQVELLFSGMSDAMRRRIIRPLKDFFRTTDGEGLRILELGCGPGSATRSVHLALPRARLVATDLSEPYLRFARKRFADTPGVEFLQADAADLPFRAGHFDAVFSVYLWHEMPLEHRKAILKESFRVLRPGGFFGFVEVVQKGEAPDFESTLEVFPKNYHEPFFRNYRANPMEPLMRSAGFERPESRVSFLVKKCWAAKPRAGEHGAARPRSRDLSLRAVCA